MARQIVMFEFDFVFALSCLRCTFLVSPILANELTSNNCFSILCYVVLCELLIIQAVDNVFFEMPLAKL